MSTKQVELFSKRVKKTPSAEADPNRYNWLRLNDTEPDLGVPTVDGALVISTSGGGRSWTDTITVENGGLQVSSIRLFDNVITTNESNANLQLDANGTGKVEVLSDFSTSGQATFSSANVLDLTQNRLVVVGANGELTDSAALTFNGAELRVDTNVEITGDATVLGSFTASGLTIQGGGAGEATFTGDTLTIGNIQIDGGVPIIRSLNSNNNLIIDAAGTGTIEITSDTNITGDLYVSGQATFESANVKDLTQNRVVLAGVNGELQDSANLTFNGTTLRVDGDIDVTGDIYLGGDIRIGDTTMDTVTVIADFTSDLVPNVTSVYNLGSDTKRWATIYGGEFDSENLTISGTAITTKLSNSNLQLDAAGTGIIDILSDTSITGNLTVTDTINVDSIVANTISLSALQIDELALEKLTVNDVQIDGNVISTVNSNSNLELDAAGTGSINLLTNTNITGTLDVSVQANLASAAVEDLTSGRVVLAGVGGELVDSANLTFDGSLLSVTGSLTVSDTINTKSLFVEDFTTVGLNVESLSTGDILIQDNVIKTTQSNSDLQLDAAGNGSIDLLTDTNVLGNLDVSDQLTAGSAVVESLSQGRVVYVGVGSELVDSANLTFDGTKLTAAEIATLTITATTIDGTTINGVNIDGQNVYGDQLLTNSLRISGNTIETVESNADIEINASGTGTIELQSNTNVTGILTVTGDLSSNSFTTGIINADSLTVDSIDAFDVAVDTLSTGNILIQDNVIKTTLSNSDLELDASGTGSIELLTDTNVTGSLTISNGITGDLIGSVFADDSTVLVDGANGKIVGPVDTTFLRTSETKIALGDGAGATNQGNYGVAVGAESGNLNQGANSIAIGYAGNTDQGTNSVAIGEEAGLTSQELQSVAIGYRAGRLSQNQNAVAIGTFAGRTTQGIFSVAIGSSAAETNQGESSVAVGSFAGQTNQGDYSVGIGEAAGFAGQADYTVALGFQAGRTNQGLNSIAIGRNAGFLNQAASSIILNASGSTLNASVSGFFVNPIRNASADGVLQYNTSTKEIVNSNTITVESLSSGQILIQDNFIKTTESNANLQLDAAGTGIIELQSDTSVTGDLTVSGSISAKSLIIEDFTTLGLTVESLSTGDILIKDNFITTTLSNSDLELDAAGTGTIELKTDTNVTGTLDVSVQANLASARVEDLTAGRVVLAGASGELQDSANLTFNGTTLSVNGDIDVTGDIMLGGNIRVGDSNTDRITILADFTSDLVPDTSNEFDLGKDSKRWNVVYANMFDTDQIQISDNRIRTFQSNANLELDAAGTGTIELQSNTNVTGNLLVSDTLTSATISVTSLGAVNVVVETLSTGDILIQDNLIKTTLSNSDLQLDASGSGSIELLANTNVTGTLDVSSQATFASANVEDLTDGRVVLAGIDGQLEDSANLTFDGSTLSVDGDVAISGNISADSLDTANIWIYGNTIETTLSNSNLELNASGSGSIELLANANVTGTLDVSSQATFASANVEDLTEDRIVLVGANGELVDSEFLTFDGVTLTVDGDVEVTGDIRIGGNIRIGDVDTDTVSVIADFTSDLIPNDSNLYDVGKDNKRWRSVYAEDFNTGEILIKDNKVFTQNSNANLELDAAGTGKVRLLSDTDVVGNLNVSGNVDVVGDITLGGNIRIGDQPLDTVTIVADFTSDLVPDASALYNIGSDAKRWNIVYAEGFDSEQISIRDNVIRTQLSNADLELETTGTGTIELKSDTNVTGTLDVSVQANLASAAVEDLTDGRVVLAGVGGELQDSGNLTFDTNTNLLTVTGDATITGTLTVDSIDVANFNLETLGVTELSLERLLVDDIEVNGNQIRTINSNADLDLDANGSGTINLLTDSTVLGTFDVSDQLTAGSAVVENLTAGRVVLAGVGGALTDSGNLTFDGSTLSVTGDVDVTGDIRLGGNIRIGDQEVDTVTVIADFTSDLVPNDAGTYNIGSPTKPWNIVYADEFNADQISIKDTLITTTQSNADLEIDAAGSGTINLLTDTNITGTLTVTGLLNAQSVTVNSLNTSEVVAESLSTGDILIKDNFITTTLSNSDLELSAVGTGTIELKTDTNVTGDLTVTGTFDVNSTATLSTAIVENLTDGRIVLAGFGGQLEDSANLTFDGATLNLVGDANITGNLAADSLELNNIWIYGNLIETTQTNSNLELNAAGTGTIELLSNTNVTGTFDVSSQATFASAAVEDLTEDRVVLVGANGELVDSVGLTFDGAKLTVDGDLEVTGDITLGGNITIGDQEIDTVTVQADFTSDLIPNASNLFDLGKINKRWRDIFAESLDTGELVIKDNEIFTQNSNSDIELTAAGTGTIRANGIDLLAFDQDTWYVSEDRGLDTNDGRRPNSAFKTIKYALSQATAGDTVVVLSGTYEEVFPLTIPAGVTVKGSGLRATKVKPTVGTNNKDGFLMNGETTVEDLTIGDMFYDSVNNTGYAFRFAPGTVITTRSPYVQRVTVLNRGSVTSSSDPYGYNQADAGRGAYVDGSQVTRASLEAAMLFNEVTFIVPNSRALILTNGARTEWLTCFTYFADLAIEGVVGATGRGGDGKTIITFSGVSGPGFSVGETIQVTSTDGSTVLTFTVDSVSGSKVFVDGKYDGLEGEDLTPGSGGGIVGLTSGTTATAIVRYDRGEFAAEMRSIASANIYGNQGVKADGDDVRIQLMAHNFGYIGTGADLSNNASAVVQANEVIEVNGGRVYYNSVDQRGDYRVGSYFNVDFETGAVTFSGGTFDVTALGSIDFIDGSDRTTITAAGITTGNLTLAGNTLGSTTGNIVIDPSGSNDIQLNGDVLVAGSVDLIEMTTDDISIKDNLIITTRSNTDLELDASGTGTIELKTNTNVTGDLDVTGTISAQSLFVEDFNLIGLTVESLSTGDILIKDNFITTTLSNSDLELDAAGTGTIELKTNTNVTGDLTVTGTVNGADLNSTSDIVLKENIRPLENARDILERINPVSFNWKNNGKLAHGVIAQEIEKVLPEIVGANDQGNKTVSYMQLIPFLIDVIKQQQAEIDEIKKQINNK